MQVGFWRLLCKSRWWHIWRRFFGFFCFINNLV